MVAMTVGSRFRLPCEVLERAGRIPDENRLLLQTHEAPHPNSVLCRWQHRRKVIVPSRRMNYPRRQAACAAWRRGSPPVGPRPRISRARRCSEMGGRSRRRGRSSVPAQRRRRRARRRDRSGRRRHRGRSGCAYRRRYTQMRSGWRPQPPTRLPAIHRPPATPRASAPLASAPWIKASTSWPGARVTGSMPRSRARSASLARLALPPPEVGLMNSNGRRAGSTDTNPD
jgi:hypothetical protein